MIYKLKKYIPLKKQIITIRDRIKKAKINSLFFDGCNELSKSFEEPDYKEIAFFADFKNAAQIFKNNFSEQSLRIIDDAEEICSHTFDLLGSGKVNLRKKINWHCDFKSGYCWDPKTFYLDIEYGKNNGVDIKVPWELSRFQHLITLGEAYQLGGNEKYAQEFIDEINDWIEENPLGYGVNWKCTMDVAIRACNWILAYGLFKNSVKITEEFSAKFSKVLFLHGKFIENNLEKSFLGLTSNHYLSDIAGLMYLGIFFKNTKQGQRWILFSKKELKKEIQKQVYADGCDFEASTCYHRLVLEILFFSTLFLITNSKNFSGGNYKNITEDIFGEKYTEKLYKMFEAVLYLLKPNGKMPQIGDNDNGRLHILKNGEVLDMRYLLTVGSIFFGEPRFKIKEFGFCEEALWIFGKEGYDIWQKLPENDLENIKSKNFSDAGWYIIRNNKDYCLISCGPNGQNGNGGHCHNDKLSFELCINGKDVIADSGTYVYTPNPEQRNKFRSTNYHNTVCVDKKEQNNFVGSNLFFIQDNAKSECLRWETSEDIDIFVGKHKGYRNLAHPVMHQREIKFYKKENKMEIKDMFRGDGQHNLEWNFYIKNKNNINFVLDKKINWNYKTADMSPYYGCKIPAEKISGEHEGFLDKEFLQTIKW